jgi:hypothetical protein
VWFVVSSAIWFSEDFVWLVGLGVYQVVLIGQIFQCLCQSAFGESLYRVGAIWWSIFPPKLLDLKLSWGCYLVEVLCALCVCLDTTNSWAVWLYWGRTGYRVYREQDGVQRESHCWISSSASIIFPPGMLSNLNFKCIHPVFHLIELSINTGLCGLFHYYFQYWSWIYLWISPVPRWSLIHYLKSSLVGMLGGLGSVFFACGRFLLSSIHWKPTRWRWSWLMKRLDGSQFILFWYFS